MANQAPAKSSLFYLYIGSEWSGPFQVEQIRFFRHHGQVESDTYAYDPDQQRHYTVGELLAAIDSTPGAANPDLLGDDNPLVPQELDDAATPSTTRVFLASEESEATATFNTSLDALPDPLRTFFHLYRDLTEGRPADREQVVAHLDETAGALGIQLSAATNDPASLTLLVADLLRLSDYLANRHQDNELWEQVDALRSLRPDSDADDCVQAARQVVAQLVTKARAGRIKLTDRHTPGLLPTVEPEQTARSTARDVHPEDALQPTDTGVHKPVSENWHQPHARTARMIMRDARKELRSTEADLEAMQQAYGQLQDQHTRDLTEAQEMLATLEYSRADEAANAAQALAEVRSLAAEIHRLAEENLSSEPDLQADIRNLADELRGQDATAMAPLAEGLLIRLVARLRNLSASGEQSADAGKDVGKDVVALREELAKSRSDLVQARAQAMVLSEERDRLRRQLDEQRGAADRAIASAKEREQRLRSTVTALEVTKDLHQDVMRELDVQLQTAQRRVGEMESELSVVRGDLANTRSNLAERTRELQDEMRRAVELQAMLEARRAELSLSLKDAESQLLQAQTAQAAPGATSDPELMEALAVKVNSLRTMFEATKRRLDEQQQLAAKLEEDLSSSRREAIDLRTRSDSLTGELDEARVGLAAAKKRFEELHRANARLEAERESLQLELVIRKGTDTLRRERDPATESGVQDKPTESNRASSTNRMTKAMEVLEVKLQDSNRRLEQATAQLDNERRRVNEINETQAQLQVRVEDLTADRDQLRTELDRLHSDHFSDHSRHAAAFASATQSTIDAERRLKEATLRVVELEGQVAFLQQHQQAPDAALQQLSADGEDQSGAHFIPSTQIIELSRQLQDARAELSALRSVGNDNGDDPRAQLAARLALVEAELSSATVSRNDAGSQLKAAIAERDRSNRELLRLKNEHESAAVEHRVSLKSARDKLTESHARVLLLEKELDQHRGGEAKSREIAVERDRLNEEVRSLSVRIERTQISAELPEVKRQLDKEQERIRTLTRSLSDAQEQADTARSRVVEMEARAGSANHEREQLHLAIERLKGELIAAQVQASPSHDSGHRELLERRLQDVLTDREQLLSELTCVNGELMQVRGRLVRAESDVIAAERLPRERSAVLDLERQLALLRNDAQATTAQLTEMRTRLGQVTGERDQLHEEVARLRSQLAALTGTGLGSSSLVAELTTLRDKLTRAKQRIRMLRKERDELLERVAGQPMATHAQQQPSQQIASASRPAAAAVAGPGQQLEERGFVSAFAHAAVGAEAALERNLEPGQPAVPGFTSRHSGLRLAPATLSFRNPQAPLPGSSSGRRKSHAASRWRSRVLLGGGVLLAVAGLTALSIYNLPVRTVNAWVNADVVTMTAPIEGRVTRNIAVPRSTAKAGVNVISLVNPDPDRHELDRLLEQSRDTEAKIAALRADREAVLKRPSAVPGVPTQSSAILGVPTTAVFGLVGILHSSEAELATLDWQITEQQRLHEELHAKTVIAEEHLSTLRAAELAVTSDSVILRLLANEGKWVKSGDPLIELADRSTMLLDATFSALAADQIKPGDEVAVNLIDDGRVVHGMVTEILNGAPVVDQRLMVELGAPPLGGIRVRISLPSNAVRPISVGQPARVLLTAADQSFVTRIGVDLRTWFWL